MGFTEVFLKKPAGNIERRDLEAFVLRGIEENINLDYTAINSVEHPRELAIEVSAFANSEGGLIVLGVSQREIKDSQKRVKILPGEITWGDRMLSKEQIEDILVGNIHPRLNGLRILPIRENNDSLRVIFLLDIPQSNDRPHMASDHRYHRRLNFRRVQMEHYEVANLIKAKAAMSEKLVEKIYEPLAAILEEQAKRLEEYQDPSEFDFRDILARTYYISQMPSEIFDELDLYIDSVKELSKKMYAARKEMSVILFQRFSEYLKSKEIHATDATNRREFKLLYSEGRRDLHTTILYMLLMSDQSIVEYAGEDFYSGSFLGISVSFDQERHDIETENLRSIWNECLKDARNSKTISEAKGLADSLWDGAHHLIRRTIQA